MAAAHDEPRHHQGSSRDDDHGCGCREGRSGLRGSRQAGVLRTWYGAPAYFVLGAVHAIVFWITVSVLTPFILIVGFFNDRRRLLHDMVVGTVLIE